MIQFIIEKIVPFIKGLLGKEKGQNIEAGNSSTNIQTGNGSQITITTIDKDKEESIQRASLEDVKRYDPIRINLISEIQRKKLHCVRFKKPKLKKEKKISYWIKKLWWLILIIVLFSLAILYWVHMGFSGQLFRWLKVQF